MRQARSRRAWACPLLSFALLAACAEPYAPEPLEATPENLALASAVLREAAARRPDVRLGEGAVVLDVWSWEWRERDLYEHAERDVWHRQELPEGAVVNERVRSPLRPVRLTPENLLGVRVQRYPLGASLEIRLSDEPAPVFLDTADAEEAERLGSALELLRPDRGAAP